MTRASPSLTPVRASGRSIACAPLDSIRFADATRGDFEAIARHHYRSRAPATFCRIHGAWHVDPAGRRKLVAIAVLSWPVPMVPARKRHFALSSGYGVALRFANQHVRTISRVIVHPQFRALGLARRLVSDLIDRCPTRYVDTLAMMGDFVGCFTSAGMTRIATRPGEAPYFLIDRETASASPSDWHCSTGPLVRPSVCSSPRSAHA